MTDPADQPSAAARRLIDRFWDDFLGLHPLFGTLAGDERFDDRLPDPSPEGLARRESVSRSALRALPGIDRGGLELESRTGLDMLESLARRELAMVEHRLDRFWAVSHMLGAHLFGPSQLLGQLGTLQRADTPERMDRYLARLPAVPAYLDAVEEVLGEAVAAGQVAPAVVVDRSISLVHRQLEAGPEASPAMQPLAGRSQDDRDRVAATLREQVVPAYARHLEALRAYRRSARETLGLGALPGGEEMYAAEILGWTTLPLDPGDLHELGAAHLDAIREEGRRIASGLGFPDAAAAVAAHTAAGENEVARDDVLHLAREQVRRGWDAASGFFGRLPRESCQVRAVPADREQDALDYYQGPTEDFTSRSCRRSRRWRRTRPWK